MNFGLVLGSFHSCAVHNGRSMWAEKGQGRLYSYHSLFSRGCSYALHVVSGEVIGGR